MRVIISIFLLTYCVVSGFSQGKQPALGILELEASGLSKEKVVKINKYIEAAFHSSNRFNIVSRQLQEAIRQEREQLKYNIDKYGIEQRQGVAIGADYIVKGIAKKYKSQIYKSSPKSREMPSRTSSQKKENTTPPSPKIDQVYTNTRISFEIKVLNVKTGVVVAEKTYNGGLNGVSYFVRGFIRSAFPQTFSILELMETKGGKKAKHLLVDGGFKHGLSKATYLNVYEVTYENVDGKQLRRDMEIGKLYVKRLDTGGHFSLCTVYKGHKAILEKLNNGTRLVVKPPKKFRFLGMDFEYIY